MSDVIDPPTKPVTEPAAAAPDKDLLASSRQLKDSGIDLNEVDWMARHNGAVGAAKQRIAELTEKNAQLDFKVKDLDARLALANAKVADLEISAGKLPELETQLSTTAAEKAALTDKVTKQQVLFGYPHLLNVGPEGGVNPLVELAMSSTLGMDDLKKQLDALSVGAPAAKPVTPGLPPGAPPQGGGTNVNYHKKAQAAYQTWINSGQTDDAAKADFDENMRLHKQSQAAQK